ncbi:DUF6118 family protein [Rhizobium oryzihabitans]|uniref:DUF6118 family protein n=1 Tax=Rhizobium oryzihabitans TaxID=2267833 RepID=UPI001FE379D7|nr:DUF6118 family protein [Rhizobium oryzihabitans]
MTDDDRNHHPEDMEPAAFHDEDDAGDPAAAFEALRDTVEDLAADLGREMTTIRKGVESAFDQLERQGAVVDYSAELGRMTQQLAIVGEHLQAIHQAPVLRQGAEHYARVLERSGDGLVRSAVQKLEQQSSDLERISSVLASHTKSALYRKDQDFRMWMMAGIGVVVGAFLLVVVPRFLPFSVDSRVAALVMGGDRVSAGRAMIQAADPQGGRDFVTAGWVYDTNREALDKCISDMFKTQKEQRCGLTLPVVQSSGHP